MGNAIQRHHCPFKHSCSPGLPIFGGLDQEYFLPLFFAQAAQTSLSPAVSHSYRVDPTDSACLRVRWAE
jgi:hypothetical protein